MYTLTVRTYDDVSDTPLRRDVRSVSSARRLDTDDDESFINYLNKYGQNTNAHQVYIRTKRNINDTESIDSFENGLEEEYNDVEDAEEVKRENDAKRTLIRRQYFPSIRSAERDVPEYNVKDYKNVRKELLRIAEKNRRRHTIPRAYSTRYDSRNKGWDSDEQPLDYGLANINSKKHRVSHVSKKVGPVSEKSDYSDSVRHIKKSEKSLVLSDKNPHSSESEEGLAKTSKLTEKVNKHSIARSQNASFEQWDVDLKDTIGNSKNATKRTFRGNKDIPPEDWNVGLAATNNEDNEDESGKRTITKNKKIPTEDWDEKPNSEENEETNEMSSKRTYENEENIPPEDWNVGLAHTENSHAHNHKERSSKRTLQTKKKSLFDDWPSGNEKENTLPDKETFTKKKHIMIDPWDSDTEQIESKKTNIVQKKNKDIDEAWNLKSGEKQNKKESSTRNNIFPMMHEHVRQSFLKEYPNDIVPSSNKRFFSGRDFSPFSKKEYDASLPTINNKRMMNLKFDSHDSDLNSVRSSRLRKYYDTKRRYEQQRKQHKTYDEDSSTLPWDFRRARILNHYSKNYKQLPYNKRIPPDVEMRKSEIHHASAPSISHSFTDPSWDYEMSKMEDSQEKASKRTYDQNKMNRIKLAKYRNERAKAFKRRLAAREFIKKMHTPLRMMYPQKFQRRVGMLPQNKRHSLNKIRFVPVNKLKRPTLVRNQIKKVLEHPLHGNSIRRFVKPIRKGLIPGAAYQSFLAKRYRDKLAYDFNKKRQKAIRDRQLRTMAFKKQQINNGQENVVELMKRLHKPRPVITYPNPRGPDMNILARKKQDSTFNNVKPNADLYQERVMEPWEYGLAKISAGLPNAQFQPVHRPPVLSPYVGYHSKMKMLPVTHTHKVGFNPLDYSPQMLYSNLRKRQMIDTLGMPLLNDQYPFFRPYYDPYSGMSPYYGYPVPTYVRSYVPVYMYPKERFSRSHIPKYHMEDYRKRHEAPSIRFFIKPKKSRKIVKEKKSKIFELSDYMEPPLYANQDAHDYSYSNPYISSPRPIVYPIMSYSKSLKDSYDLRHRNPLLTRKPFVSSFTRVPPLILHKRLPQNKFLAKKMQTVRVPYGRMKNNRIYPAEETILNHLRSPKVPTEERSPPSIMSAQLLNALNYHPKELSLEGSLAKSFVTRTQKYVKFINKMRNQTSFANSNNPNPSFNLRNRSAVPKNSIVIIDAHLKKSQLARKIVSTIAQYTRYLKQAKDKTAMEDALNAESAKKGTARSKHYYNSVRSKIALKQMIANVENLMCEYNELLKGEKSAVMNDIDCSASARKKKNQKNYGAKLKDLDKNLSNLHDEYEDLLAKPTNIQTDLPSLVHHEKHYPSANFPKEHVNYDELLKEKTKAKALSKAMGKLINKTIEDMNERTVDEINGHVTSESVESTNRKSTNKGNKVEKVDKPTHEMFDEDFEDPDAVELATRNTTVATTADHFVNETQPQSYSFTEDVVSVSNQTKPSVELNFDNTTVNHEDVNQVSHKKKKPSVELNFDNSSVNHEDVSQVSHKKGKPSAELNFDNSPENHEDETQVSHKKKKPLVELNFDNTTAVHEDEAQVSHKKRKPLDELNFDNTTVTHDDETQVSHKTNSSVNDGFYNSFGTSGPDRDNKQKSKAHKEEPKKKKHKHKKQHLLIEDDEELEEDLNRTQNMMADLDKTKLDKSVTNKTESTKQKPHKAKVTVTLRTKPNANSKEKTVSTFSTELTLDLKKSTKNKNKQGNKTLEEINEETLPLITAPNPKASSSNSSKPNKTDSNNSKQNTPTKIKPLHGKDNKTSTGNLTQTAYNYTTYNYSTPVSTYTSYNTSNNVPVYNYYSQNQTYAYTTPNTTYSTYLPSTNSTTNVTNNYYKPSPSSNQMSESAPIVTSPSENRELNPKNDSDSPPSGFAETPVEIIPLNSFSEDEEENSTVTTEGNFTWPKDDSNWSTYDMASSNNTEQADTMSNVFSGNETYIETTLNASSPNQKYTETFETVNLNNTYAYPPATQSAYYNYNYTQSAPAKTTADKRTHHGKKSKHKIHSEIKLDNSTMSDMLTDPTEPAKFIKMESPPDASEELEKLTHPLEEGKTKTKRAKGKNKDKIYVSGIPRNIIDMGDSIARHTRADTSRRWNIASYTALNRRLQPHKPLLLSPTTFARTNLLNLPLKSVLSRPLKPFLRDVKSALAEAKLLGKPIIAKLSSVEQQANQLYPAFHAQSHNALIPENIINDENNLGDTQFLKSIMPYMEAMKEALPDEFAQVTRKDNVEDIFKDNGKNESNLTKYYNYLYNSLKEYELLSKMNLLNTKSAPKKTEIHVLSNGTHNESQGISSMVKEILKKNATGKTRGNLKEGVNELIRDINDLSSWINGSDSMENKPKNTSTNLVDKYIDAMLNASSENESSPDSQSVQKSTTEKSEQSTKDENAEKSSSSLESEKTTSPEGIVVVTDYATNVEKSAPLFNNSIQDVKFFESAPESNSMKLDIAKNMNLDRENVLRYFKKKDQNQKGDDEGSLVNEKDQPSDIDINPASESKKETTKSAHNNNNDKKPDADNIHSVNSVNKTRNTNNDVKNDNRVETKNDNKIPPNSNNKHFSSSDDSVDNHDNNDNNNNHHGNSDTDNNNNKGSDNNHKDVLKSTSMTSNEKNEPTIQILKKTEPAPDVNKTNGTMGTKNDDKTQKMKQILFKLKNSIYNSMKMYNLLLRASNKQEAQDEENIKAVVAVANSKPKESNTMFTSNDTPQAPSDVSNNMNSTNATSPMKSMQEKPTNNNNSQNATIPNMDEDNSVRMQRILSELKNSIDNSEIIMKIYNILLNAKKRKNATMAANVSKLMEQSKGNKSESDNDNKSNKNDDNDGSPSRHFVHNYKDIDDTNSFISNENKNYNPDPAVLIESEVTKKAKKLTKNVTTFEEIKDEKSSESASEKKEEKSAEKASEKASSSEKASEKSSSAEKASSSEKASEKSSEKSSEKTSEKLEEEKVINRTVTTKPAAELNTQHTLVVNISIDIDKSKEEKQKAQMKESQKENNKNVENNKDKDKDASSQFTAPVISPEPIDTPLNSFSNNKKDKDKDKNKGKNNDKNNNKDKDDDKDKPDKDDKSENKLDKPPPPPPPPPSPPPPPPSPPKENVKGNKTPPEGHNEKAKTVFQDTSKPDDEKPKIESKDDGKNMEAPVETAPHVNHCCNSCCNTCCTNNTVAINTAPAPVPVHVYSAGQPPPVPIAPNPVNINPSQQCVPCNPAPNPVPANPAPLTPIPVNPSPQNPSPITPINDYTTTPPNNQTQTNTNYNCNCKSVFDMCKRFKEEHCNGETTRNSDLTDEGKDTGEKDDLLDKYFDSIETKGASSSSNSDNQKNDSGVTSADKTSRLLSHESADDKLVKEVSNSLIESQWQRVKDNIHQMKHEADETERKGGDKTQDFVSEKDSSTNDEDKTDQKEKKHKKIQETLVFINDMEKEIDNLIDENKKHDAFLDLTRAEKNKIQKAFNDLEENQKKNFQPHLTADYFGKASFGDSNAFRRHITDSAKHKDNNDQKVVKDSSHFHETPQKDAAKKEELDIPKEAMNIAKSFMEDSYTTINDFNQATNVDNNKAVKDIQEAYIDSKALPLYDMVGGNGEFRGIENFEGPGSDFIALKSTTKNENARRRGDILQHIKQDVDDADTERKKKEKIHKSEETDLHRRFRPHPNPSTTKSKYNVKDDLIHPAQGIYDILDKTNKRDQGPFSTKDDKEDIEKTDKLDQIHQAEFVNKLQNAEMSETLSDLKQVTQNGLKTMFADAVGKQNNFINSVSRFDSPNVVNQGPIQEYMDPVTSDSSDNQMINEVSTNLPNPSDLMEVSPSRDYQEEDVPLYAVE